MKKQIRFGMKSKNKKTTKREKFSSFLIDLNKNYY